MRDYQLIVRCVRTAHCAAWGGKAGPGPAAVNAAEYLEGCGGPLLAHPARSLRCTTPSAIGGKTGRARGASRTIPSPTIVCGAKNLPNKVELLWCRWSDLDKGPEEPRFGKGANNTLVLNGRFGVGLGELSIGFIWIA
jgi:hypothetical protein